MADDSALHQSLEVITNKIAETRNGAGRLFVSAVGGMLDPASYLVSELERHARVTGICLGNTHPATLSSLCNDKGGWDNAYTEALKVHDFGANDMLLTFSVGGGQPGISNVVSNAMLYAKEQGGFIAAFVGKESGGVAHEKADSLIVVPSASVDKDHISGLTQDGVRVLCSAIIDRLKITARTFDASPTFVS